MAKLVQEHIDALEGARNFIANPSVLSEAALDSMRATIKLIESYIDMDQAEYNALVAKKRAFIRRMSSSEPLL